MQGDRLAQSARRLVGLGEVVARGQGVGVVRAEQPLAIGEVALVQGDRLAQPARRLVGLGEVVA